LNCGYPDDREEDWDRPERLQLPGEAFRLVLRASDQDALAGQFHV
jgi:hypothetical protein